MKRMYDTPGPATTPARQKYSGEAMRRYMRYLKDDSGIAAEDGRLHKIPLDA